MIRWFVTSLLVFAIYIPGFAQTVADDVGKLQAEIDSLLVIKTGLNRQLEAVTAHLEALQEQMLRLQYASMDSTDIIVMTNMEASLRMQPSPGARVVRIIPEHTPLAAVDYEGAYWKVRYQGLEGWVMRLFVDEGEDASAFKKMHAQNQTGGASSAKAGKKSNRYAERVGKNLLVTSFGIHPPNSAGGISIYYAFEHLDSTRTIREITFSVTPYNAEGLIEKGNNSGVSTKRLRRFGPISVFDGERQYQFENVWYNERIHCAQIDRIDVVFTDGSRSSHRNDLQSLMVHALENDCTVQPAAQDTVFVKEQY